MHAVGGHINKLIELFSSEEGWKEELFQQLVCDIVRKSDKGIQSAADKRYCFANYEKVILPCIVQEVDNAMWICFIWDNIQQIIYSSKHDTVIGSSLEANLFVHFCSAIMRWGIAVVTLYLHQLLARINGMKPL
jgi:hypothetical protein